MISRYEIPGSLLKVRILVTNCHTRYISRSASDEKSTRILTILITEDFHYFHVLTFESSHVCDTLGY